MPQWAAQRTKPPEYDPATLPKYLSIHELASLLGIGWQVIRRRVIAGKIKAESEARGTKQDVYRIRRAVAVALRKRVDAGERV